MCSTTPPIVAMRPVANGALDVGPGLELAIECAPRQLGHFIIGRESEANELLRSQISDSAAHVAWENPLQSDAFLQTNDAILSAKRHGPGNEDSCRQRNRHDHCPPVHYARISPESHSDNHHVGHQYGKGKEMPRRNEPTMGCKRLGLFCHPGSLWFDPASTPGNYLSPIIVREQPLSLPISRDNDAGTITRSVRVRRVRTA